MEKIKTIKSDPPIQVLYWLIWEYGLGDLLSYISDLKLLINEGLKWQRFRGTPDSLKLALGWVGIDDIEIEEEVPGIHFYQYQLKLGEIPDRVKVDNIINLSRLSAPVRSRLSRLYNTLYDNRRLILSDPDGRGKFGYLLSDYSGVHYKDIVLSFGRKEGFSLTVPARQVKNGHSRAVKIKLNPLDYPVLGDMIISDAPIPNRTSAIHRLTAIRFIHPGSQPLSLAGLDWFGTWGRRTWEEPGFISLGVRQLRFHCFKQDIPALSPTGERRYTYHTFPVFMDEPELKRTQTRTHTFEDSIPGGSAGVLRYTGLGIPVEYTGTASGSRLAREFTGGTVYTEDTDNPPRIARNRQFAAIQLRQENGMPLFSAGSNWFGQWDERTWASPLFTNIGVIHGNTN